MLIFTSFYFVRFFRGSLCTRLYIVLFYRRAYKGPVLGAMFKGCYPATTPRGGLTGGVYGRTLRIKEDDMKLLSRVLFLWRKQWADIARGFKYALSPTPTRYSPPPKTDNPIATDWSDADIARLQSTINNYKYDNK